MAIRVGDIDERAVLDDHLCNGDREALRLALMPGASAVQTADALRLLRITNDQTAITVQRRRALIKSHYHVRTQIMLDLDRFFRREAMG